MGFEYLGGACAFIWSTNNCIESGAITDLVEQSSEVRSALVVGVLRAMNTKGSRSNA